MLFLLIPIIIGKIMYDLTLKYEKNGWLYPILGIVIYYLATIILGILFDLLYPSKYDSIYADPLFLGASVVVGLGAFAAYYFLMKKSWGQK